MRCELAGAAGGGMQIVYMGAAIGLDPHCAHPLCLLPITRKPHLAPTQPYPLGPAASSTLRLVWSNRVEPGTVIWVKWIQCPYADAINHVTGHIGFPRPC
jgi:hypothetical protein